MVLLHLIFASFCCQDILCRWKPYALFLLALVSSWSSVLMWALWRCESIGCQDGLRRCVDFRGVCPSLVVQHGSCLTLGRLSIPSHFLFLFVLLSLRPQSLLCLVIIVTLIPLNVIVVNKTSRPKVVGRIDLHIKIYPIFFIENFWNKKVMSGNKASQLVNSIINMKWV